MKINKKTTYRVIAVLVAAVLLTGAYFYVYGNTDKVVMECNGVKIRDSVYKMYIYSCAQEFNDAYNKENSSDFWETKIGGELPIYYIKEKVKSKIQIYSHKVIECEKSNIEFGQDEYNYIYRSYQDELIDYDTDSLVGVPLKHYISFMIQLEKFDILRDRKYPNIDVSSKEIEDYFNENRVEFAKVSAKTIFIFNENKDIENKEEFLKNIKEQIEHGADIDEMIRKYSEYIGNSGGLFEDIINSSGIGNTLGYKYNEKLLNSNEGEINIFQTEKGYCLNQVIKLEKQTFADTDITMLLQKEKYDTNIYDIIDENNDDYEIKIVNQKLFDSGDVPYLLKGDANEK